MFDRITQSRHFGTFVGVFVAGLALVAVGCFVVGVAVVADRIAGVMT